MSFLTKTEYTDDGQRIEALDVEKVSGILKKMAEVISVGHILENKGASISELRQKDFSGLEVPQYAFTKFGKRLADSCIR